MLRYTILRKFQRDIENETSRARALFTQPGCHLDRDLWSRPLVINTITEEIGKLARCCNKLSIAVDGKVREEWLDEAYFRIITASSLLRRMAENLENFPDK